MNGDIFTSSSDRKIKRLINEDDNNFFMKRDIPGFNNSGEPASHLNDYDYNLLREDAYKDIKDDVFKLEYKIAKAEEYLKNIDGQIQAAKEILDFSEAEKLFERRKKVQENLRTLFDMYNQASISAKISGDLTYKIKDNFKNVSNIFEKFGEKLIKKLPKRMSAFFEIKSSLAKLENISRSVDELVALQIPYGEAADKYEQLSKYIVKANAIQSNIAKHFK